MAPRAPALRRELGRWDLTAIGDQSGHRRRGLRDAGGARRDRRRLEPVPDRRRRPRVDDDRADVRARSPAASTATGGPYLYTRAAFGRFPAFEVGWMQWFTRVASWASVINVLVASLGFYWPAVTAGPRPDGAADVRSSRRSRFINVLGIRQSAWVRERPDDRQARAARALHRRRADRRRLSQALPIGPLPPLPKLSTSALLLIFAFGGYEVIPVPAGESKDPRRDRAVRADHDDRRRDRCPRRSRRWSRSARCRSWPTSKTPLADASARLHGRDRRRR